jgi:hypothetical protein
MQHAVLSEHTWTAIDLQPHIDSREVSVPINVGRSCPTAAAAAAAASAAELSALNSLYSDY